LEFTTTMGDISPEQPLVVPQMSADPAAPYAWAIDP
jgi:hypothetical protein